ncbi:hypothetical protein Tsubulata_025250 [Turnera subulata]|uniref:DDT domain-containing protein n=1 Tax=Turnera subulata TaxID=218843 RepID=A0A9Q0JJX0_9ROSI|nr:hypothetical protein Tsubulata_025250 [Turnera subulata]
MPLLKKKPFSLLEPPENLDPHDLVYQVRFTKEIFTDYQYPSVIEYLNRINLYRQRTWTCKITGKPNLTFEEALLSEKHAANKVQEIPQELVAPALRLIQFSMLSLKDLADTLASKLQAHLYTGAELHGRKGSSLHPCKILKVLNEFDVKTQYEVAWLDKNKKKAETAIVNGDDLTWKKFPLSRSILKSFVRKSTYRSSPWVLYEKLAQKHGISNDPPEDLKSKVFVQNGLVHNKKGKNGENKNAAGELEACGKSKKRKVEGERAEAANGKIGKEEYDDAAPIKYPIDDLLVQPSSDDPVFTQRPLPSRDFNIPLYSVGNLLMVWDFCSSFGKLLHLWPFSLEDFEKSICHKGSNLSLIVETHAALLHIITEGNSEYSLAMQKRFRTSKVTLVNWTERLCDFIEMRSISGLSTHVTTIKRGHYGLLDAEVKLEILQELVNQVLETDFMRKKLDEYVDKRQALGATRRMEALAEGRRKREEKGKLKGESIANGVTNGHGMDNIGNRSDMSDNEDNTDQNMEMEKESKEVILSQQNHASEKRFHFLVCFNSEVNHCDTASKKLAKRQKIDMEGQTEILKASRKEALKLLRDENEKPAARSKQQRVDHLLLFHSFQLSKMPYISKFSFSLMLFVWQREYFEREMEKWVLCANSLGKDRYYDRYWWFQSDGRIFVESSDSKIWGYYSSKEELDLLMRSLNQKGERERALHKQLEKFYDRICLKLQKRTKDLVHRISLEESEHRRSSRVRTLPRETTANAFLGYVNKWKED